MWVTKEMWLDGLRLEKEPEVWKNNDDRVYYGFCEHYWGAVSIYDWHKYSVAPHYFGIILVCDPKTGLPKREVSILTADTPDLIADNPVFELAEFKFYNETYHNCLLDCLVPTVVMEACIFIQKKDDKWRPDGLRRNVYSLDGEKPWYPEDDEFARGPVKSWPKKLGYILEEGFYNHLRKDKWHEDVRVIYEGNYLDYDSEGVEYYRDREGNISDPVYIEGDEGGRLDLSRVPFTLGKARVIRFTRLL